MFKDGSSLEWMQEDDSIASPSAADVMEDVVMDVPMLLQLKLVPLKRRTKNLNALLFLCLRMN